MVCCAVLYCTVMYCAVLYCTVLYCTVLYCTVLYCTVLYCTVQYDTILCCTALCCILLSVIIQSNVHLTFTHLITVTHVHRMPVSVQSSVCTTVCRICFTTSPQALGNTLFALGKLGKYAMHVRVYLRIFFYNVVESNLLDKLTIPTFSSTFVLFLFVHKRL